MTRTVTTLALACMPALAAAQAGLAQPQAPAGSAYTATLRIGHGCEGTPTHTVVVPSAAAGTGPRSPPAAPAPRA